MQGSLATRPLFRCPFSVQTRGDWGTFRGVWAALGDNACNQGIPAVMAWQTVHHREASLLCADTAFLSPSGLVHSLTRPVGHACMRTGGTSCLTCSARPGLSPVSSHTCA